MTSIVVLSFSSESEFRFHSSPKVPRLAVCDGCFRNVAISRTQQYNDITGNKILRSKSLSQSITDHGRFRNDAFGECRNGLNRSRFLDEANNSVQEHHTQDHTCIDGFLKPNCHRSSD